MADIKVQPITPEHDSQVKDWILRHHYIKRWPTGVRYKLGVFVNGKIQGVLLYGPPLRAQSGTDLFKDSNGNPIMNNNQVLELLRAYTTDEAKDQIPNLGSMVIAKGNAFVQEHGESKQGKPIRAILSYADPEAKHSGTVYKATNALYLGTQRPSKVLVVTDPKTKAGIEINPMSLRRFRTLDINKLRQEELFKGKELSWENRSGKHKYLYPLGKTQKHRNALIAHLTEPLFSYPEPGKESHEIPNPAKQTKIQPQQKTAPHSKSEMVKQLLRSKVYNPETERKILVKTALKYDKNHPSHRQARGMLNAYSKKYGISIKAS